MTICFACEGKKKMFLQNGMYTLHTIVGADIVDCPECLGAGKTVTEEQRDAFKTQVNAIVNTVADCAVIDKRSREYRELKKSKVG